MSAVEENASDNKLSENNYDWQDNIDDETKQSKGKANIQGGQVIVPDTWFNKQRKGAGGS